MPKISVIVPVYKVEYYIGKCIESILNQTVTDFELILINDGSPDMSGVICDEYAKKDSRIKVFHKDNEGVSVARNYGIINSSGEWICFVDSDDWLDRTYLEDFGLENDEFDMYMQGYRKFNNHGSVKDYSFINCISRDFWAIIAYSEDNCIINSPCFKLFKRSIIVDNKIQYDKNTSYGEDHLFSLDYILHINTVTCSNSIGYNYRISDRESLTQRIVPFKEIIYYALTAREKQIKILEKSYSAIYKKSIDNTLITNYIRTLKYSFLNKCNCNDYQYISRAFEKYFKSIRLKNLPFVYCMLIIFSKKIFGPIMFFVLRKGLLKC